MNNDMNNIELNQIHLQEMHRMARYQQLLLVTPAVPTVRRSLMTTLLSIWQSLFC